MGTSTGFYEGDSEKRPASAGVGIPAAARAENVAACGECLQATLSFYVTNN